MKILNNSCTNQKTNSNVTIVPNSSFACLPSSNHHYQISDRTLSIGRFNTLGLTTIDPQLSSVCGADTLTIRGNLQICDNLLTVGSTQLHDLSANWIQYWNNSTFFNWGVHIIPISGQVFILGMDALMTQPGVTSEVGHTHTLTNVSGSGAGTGTLGSFTTDANDAGTQLVTSELGGTDDTHKHDIKIPHNIHGHGIPPQTTTVVTVTNSSGTTDTDAHAHEIESVSLHDIKIKWDDGWIYPGFGGYAMNTGMGIPGWSDRSSYPTDGFWQKLYKYSFAICIPIPFDGWIICDSSNQPFADHHHFHMTGGCSNTICGTGNHSHHNHGGPASRFSWNLGKYDGVAPPVFSLGLGIYIVRCNNSNPQIPEKIGEVIIDKRCGHGKWGVVTSPASTITVNAGDAIGIYIKNNTGRIHSPATFTLEVHRKF
jgi:hypothetical protein